MRLRLPNHVKVFGANICADVTTLNVGTGAWPAMWSEWNWDGWIKPQIDLIIGNGVGCNMIRCQGAAFAVQKGTIPMATYLARWSQLIEYCAARGVYVYPCGCTNDTDTSFALPVSTMGAVFAEIFRHHQQYDNVACIDVIQEMDLEGASVWPTRQPQLRALIEDIKSRGVTVPLTFSSGEFIDSGFPWLTAMASYVDYLDMHLYYHSITNSSLDTMLAAFPEHDFVIGEFGAEAGWSTADAHVAYLRSALNLANIGHPRMRGGLIWCATDPRVEAGKLWGQYTYGNVPRQDRLALLRQYTGGSVVRCNRVH